MPKGRETSRIIAVCLMSGALAIASIGVTEQGLARGREPRAAADETNEERRVREVRNTPATPRTPRTNRSVKTPVDILASPAPKPAQEPRQNRKQEGSLPENRNPTSIDLLSLPTWDYAAGIERTDQGLRVEHAGMAILNREGSYEEFWPFLAYGPHIETSADFSIRMELEAIRGEAAMNIYGELPLVYDERRYEQGALRIAIEDGSFWVGIWDGTADEPIITREWFFTPSSKATVEIKHVGNELEFGVNGWMLGRVPDRGIYSDDRLWFGFDSSDEGGSFLVSGLSAAATSGGRLELVEPEILTPARPHPRSFQEMVEAIRPGFNFGTAVALGPLVSDREYAGLATSGWFGAWTPENAMKMQFIHPQPNRYTFGEADAIVELARQHGVDIHGHALVFGEANPRWVTDIAGTEPARLEAVMKRHVTAVVKHYSKKYPGTVSSWDVVNEPLAIEATPDNPLRQHIWQQAMGERYIDIAFRTAHKIDPDARLYVNEWGLDDPGWTERWDAFLSLVDRLLARGVPIHGVGFQGHVYEPGDEIDPTVLKRRFDQLALRGLDVRISELDVHDEHGETAQAEQFAAILQACLDAPNCTGVGIWGISERYGSTANTDGEIPEIGSGLPWDKRYDPLAAVSAMQRVLRDRANELRRNR